LLPDIFGIEPDLTQMQPDGEPRVMKVSFKPWCAARQTMPATQALREIVDSGVAPSDIAAVEASVLPQHLKMIDHGIRPGDRGAHVTSLPYQMAVAVLDAQAQFDLEQAPQALPDAITSFMGKVKVSADPALLDGYPASWSARVVVTARGARHERVVNHVPGDPDRPFTADDAAQKFRRLVGAIAKDRADELLALASTPVEQDGQATRLLHEIERFYEASR
jgi:2-methylcitrate dehydratase PrpD